MKYLLFLLVPLLCACNRNGGKETASLLHTQSMLASNDPNILLTSLSHLLTPEDRDRLYRYYPKTLDRIEQYKKLSSQDIINMTKAGVEDDVILHLIRATRSTFFLTPDDEKQLSQAGVSRRVIVEMKNTVDDRY